MNILITGSKGFIGSNLVPFLKKTYTIVEWDLKDNKDIFSNDLEDIFKNIDVVVHLAALTAVNESFENKNKYFVTNVLGTSRIAYLCVKYKKRLIYPSSAAIFHPELSPYAHTKAVAEEIVNGISKSIPAVILRLYNVFGLGMNPDSGSIMYNFLTSDKLIVYGDGEQTRDFIHIQDVIRIIKAAIEDKIWNGEIVDVGSGQAFSTNYIAGLFSYFRGMRIKYQMPRREIKWSTANVSMLRLLYRKELITNLANDIPDLCKKFQLS